MMDVTSLYSNIGHEMGLKCTEYYLINDPEIPASQRSFILEGLQFNLENNYFKYNVMMYQQLKGTMMGTWVAPFYAKLFMGWFENVYILSNHSFRSKLVMYRCYINNLFFLWCGNEVEATELCGFLNSTDWGIIFTPKCHIQEIDFLDLIISHIEVES